MLSVSQFMPSMGVPSRIKNGVINIKIEPDHFYFPQFKNVNNPK